MSTMHKLSTSKQQGRWSQRVLFFIYFFLFFWLLVCAALFRSSVLWDSINQNAEGLELARSHGKEPCILKAFLAWALNLTYLDCRELTEERDTLAAELKHSEGQFAVLVGEILDQRLESIQNMVSAAVSPPASPERKSVDAYQMVNFHLLNSHVARVRVLVNSDLSLLQALASVHCLARQSCVDSVTNTFPNIICTPMLFYIIV